MATGSIDRQHGMPYRTTLELTSGDRSALDGAVDRLCALAAAKGAEITGPHTRPGRTVSVPLFKRLEGGDRFDTWEYEVCVRELAVVGHEGVARTIASTSLPDSVAVSLTIDHVERVGQRD